VWVRTEPDDQGGLTYNHLQMASLGVDTPRSKSHVETADDSLNQTMNNSLYSAAEVIHFILISQSNA